MKARETTSPEGVALEFAPAIIQAQEEAPSPLPRMMLYLMLGLLAAVLAWTALGRLDIVAAAPGKLVPQTFIKVVQPAEAGIVTEILVKEGEEVKHGQILMRMDRRIAEADRRLVEDEFKLKGLQLRRVEAELSGMPLARRTGDPDTLYAEVEAQYRARRQTYLDALEAERAVLARAQQDLRSALEVEAKLRQTAPLYRQQEEAWKQLAREGFAGKLMALDRSRSRIENEQDLKAQGANVASLKATIAQSEKRLAQITSGYRQQLHNERVEALAQLNRLRQESDKLDHRHALLELRAPENGIVKDLATHTPGTVVAPGTVLATVVPRDEPLQAEVWVSNLDSGFVEVGHTARVKVAAYPFQKYGVLEGRVTHVGVDSSERAAGIAAGSRPLQDAAYRMLIALEAQHLHRDGRRYRLQPGMQVAAEIHLGERTVLEYLLSPVQKTFGEAGRER